MQLARYKLNKENGSILNSIAISAAATFSEVTSISHIANEEQSDKDRDYMGTIKINILN